MIIPANSLKHLMPDHAPIEVNWVFAIRFDGSKIGLCTVVVVFIAFLSVELPPIHACVCQVCAVFPNGLVLLMFQVKY